MGISGNLSLISSYFALIGSILFSISAFFLFHIKHIRKFEQEYPTLNKGEYNWLIWPAVAANYLFEYLFGKVGTRIRDLFTWRSVGVTFLISLLANSICIILILTSIPNDLEEPFDLRLIQILGLSHIVFIVFNFLGDLASINITRHAVSKIVAGKCNILRYLLIDISGILLGYFITLSPTLSILTYCLITGDEINQWIDTGILGNALIPFFLFIFATTNMPIPFSVFAFIAVFSVTIPTVIYLLLMTFCYFGYRVSLGKEDNLSFIGGIFRFLSIVSKVVLFLSPILAALAFIIQFG